jgi:hypothetical protein
MDHIVFLDSEANELENLIMGNKSMIIRGSSEQMILHGRVTSGDILYFIADREDNMVKAKGVVSFVLSSEELSCEESFEIIIKHQDKLQLPDKQFERIAGSKFLILIGLTGMEEVEPFHIMTG